MILISRGKKTCEYQILNTLYTSSAYPKGNYVIFIDIYAHMYL